MASAIAAAETNHSARRIQFGTFEADLNAGELRRSGIRIRLQSQPFRLLSILAEHPGEVVSRETLQLELWDANTIVNFDHCLGIAVNKLRDALGDSAENPRFVETLARRGYRFIAPVRTIDREVITTPLMESPAVPFGHSRTFWPWLAAGLAVVCLILCALLTLRSPVRTPYHVAQATFSGHMPANDLNAEGSSNSARDGAGIHTSQMESGRQQDLWIDPTALVFVRSADLHQGCRAGHGERYLIAVNDADRPRSLSFSVQHTALEGCTIFRHELGSGTAQTNGTQLTVDLPAKQAVMFRTQ
ncbi:MAG TPA: winged helix-turn-helix domain-containing protein [Terracidiphilus sp.]|nr:winged helix-turn-helix domain-containing protein [Terracidiphilus sp.]